MTVQEYLKNVYYNDGLSAICAEMKHGTQLILDVRGWGWLTTHGGMNSDQAAKFQDEIGVFTAQAITEKLQREAIINKETN